MADDFIPLLTKFHRDVLLPDLQPLIVEFRQANARFEEVKVTSLRSTEAPRGAILKRLGATAGR